jgi:hypothetical protein
LTQLRQRLISGATRGKAADGCRILSPANNHKKQKISVPSAVCHVRPPPSVEHGVERNRLSFFPLLAGDSHCLQLGKARRAASADTAGPEGASVRVHGSPPNMDGRHGSRGGRSRNLSHEPLMGGVCKGRHPLQRTSMARAQPHYPKREGSLSWKLITALHRRSGSPNQGSQQQQGPKSG